MLSEGPGGRRVLTRQRCQAQVLYPAPAPAPKEPAGPPHLRTLSEEAPAARPLELPRDSSSQLQSTEGMKG